VLPESQSTGRVSVSFTGLVQQLVKAVSFPTYKTRSLTVNNAVIIGHSSPDVALPMSAVPCPRGHARGTLPLCMRHFC